MFSTDNFGISLLKYKRPKNYCKYPKLNLLKKIKIILKILKF